MGWLVSEDLENLEYLRKAMNAIDITGSGLISNSDFMHLVRNDGSLHFRFGFTEDEIPEISEEGFGDIVIEDFFEK